jgi:hypothetical protein
MAATGALARIAGQVVVPAASLLKSFNIFLQVVTN